MDDFWYISDTSNKHMTANLKFFKNLEEDFAVEPLEKLGKLLFTYGIGEVLIANGDKTYLIPGVYYAPEVTLNILSMKLLKQQGFEISSNKIIGNRCTLEYMFKNKKGLNIDVDKMRRQHNEYLENYFNELDRKANDERTISQGDDKSELENFQDCVALLDLIKEGELSKWEIHRERFNKIMIWFFNHFLLKPLPGSLPPIIKGVTIHLFDLFKLIECMGRIISVQIEEGFGLLAEIIGLTGSDGLEIQGCYAVYLESLVSQYKAARSIEGPMGGHKYEGIRRFKNYHGDSDMRSAAAMEKGRVEHFGIALEEEEEGKCDATDEEGLNEIRCNLYQPLMNVQMMKTRLQQPVHQQQDNKTTWRILKAHQATVLLSSLEETEAQEGIPLTSSLKS